MNAAHRHVPEDPEVTVEVINRQGEMVGAVPAVLTVAGTEPTASSCVTVHTLIISNSQENVNRLTAQDRVEPTPPVFASRVSGGVDDHRSPSGPDGPPTSTDDPSSSQLADSPARYHRPGGRTPETLSHVSTPEPPGERVRSVVAGAITPGAQTRALPGHRAAGHTWLGDRSARVGDCLARAGDLLGCLS